jgi:N4-gp56 family major capsid protein
MSLTTTGQIAGPVNVIFQVNLLRNAKALCPYFVGSTPAEISFRQGTFSARWRRIENLTPTTTPLAELTGSLAFPTRSAVQPTVTDVDSTVEKFGNFFYLNEEVDLVNFNGQSAKLSEVLGINAGQSLNRLQRNVIEDGATAIFGGTGTTATSISTATGGITNSDITVANNALQNNIGMKFMPMSMGEAADGTAPIRDAYWGLTHVDVEEDIRLLAGFQSVETYAGQTETARGEIGTVGGVRFISTTEASIDADSGATITGTATSNSRSTSGTSADVYNTVILAQDAVGSLGFGSNHVQETYTAGDRLPAVMMVGHDRGSAGSADPLNEVSSVGWKSWHSGQILNPAWVRVIQHSTSKLEP